METNVLGRGDEVFPSTCILHADFSPERIDELKADRDMAHELAAFIVVHVETILGHLVFPQFSAIVKQNAGQQKIGIQLWIERRDLLCDAHHLGGVLDQSATARMMIIAGSSGATKTLAPFV